MHQHRRRKKRPSYGVRTVEISRGKNGFGFTISGQAPCILSCIITGSPAEKAGLRPGDYLIAVNGQNVSKAPHDDVVRLIGNSSDVLKLQIAENYYSDSSEEEFISIVKLRPKYPNKIRNRHHNSVSRAEKVVQDLQTGALFVDHIHGNNVNVIPKPKTPAAGHAGPSRTNKVLLDLILQQRLQEANRHSLQNTSSKPLSAINAASASSEKSKQIGIKKKEKVLKSRSHPEHLNTSSSSASEVFHSIFTEQDLNNILYPAIYASQNNNEQKNNQEQAVLNAVVGYLGTIEMPKEPQLPNSRLQTIRNCIRRLRVEKKVHTLVLMSVFTDCIILINPQGVTLAEFSADKITFSGVYSDDKKFFGLVTNHGVNSEEFSGNSQEEQSSLSSSCHVFMVDPKLTPHHQHIKRAKAFNITCTSDPITNKCKEFPESASSILQAVVGLYRSKLGFNNEVLHGLEFHVNMSPQLSNTSSNSSNSDSGIGFRDEGNASDRVFVVDLVDNYHQYSTNSLDRQAFSTPGIGLLESPLRSFSLSQDSPLLTPKSVSHSQTNENTMKNSKSPCQFDRLTVRAMPDPVGFERNCNSHSTDHLEQSKLPTTRSSLHNMLQYKQDSSSCTKINKNLNRLGTCLVDNLYDNSKNSASVESSPNKLSPKVYGLNYPLKSVDKMGFCNTSADGWECTSCSTEELQVQSRHLMLQETQDTTEQEEDGSQDVHPPTQEEDSESEISGMEHGSNRKWGRTSSLRRHLGRKRSLHRSTHEAGTVSDGELASGKVSTSSSMLALDRLSDTSHRSSCASERPIDVGRVGSWAAGFNVLLEDPAGLHTFSEFLKKEFSQENITFWIACERYRQLKDQSLMTEMAKEIYNKHLCIGAHEPVNVDSHARQVAQEGLNTATPDLFLPAQKQIFNLMKFDCYQRFLKSTMFKECMLREMKGQPLLYQGQLTDSSVYDNEKEKSSVEMKKRKSLIPWHKLSKTKSNESKCSGSKLWDRQCKIRKSLKKKKKEKDSHKLDDTSSTQSDMTDRSSLTSSETGVGMIYKNVSSRESLNSAELTLFPSHYGSDSYYCRVILPDLSTTVVRTQTGETVGEMLLKLLERRSLTYNAVEAYIVGSHQPLDHYTDVTTLSCKEIRVEQVILFCVELPNKKTIGVKAKNNKICSDILKPVLNKYGYKIEDVTMNVASLQKSVVLNAPITTIDNQRIVVEVKELFLNTTEPYGIEDKKSPGNELRSTRSFPDLEELTNQIFDDLLKTRPEFQYDGLGVMEQERTADNNKNIYKSSNLFQRVYQQDIESTQCTSKVDGIKMPVENKPLLPHNPTRVKSIFQDSSDICLSCLNEHSLDVNFDGISLDLSHGKENCPLLNKKEIKNNSSFSGREEYGLSTSFHNTESGFTSEMVYSTNQLADKYFSKPCFSSNDFEATSSEKFLQDLGIIPSSVGNIKSRHSQWSNLKSCQLRSPPRLPPRVRSELKDSSNLNSSPTSNMDSTLIANDSYELCPDADVTLLAHSDESLSPLRGFSPDATPQIEEPPIERELSKETVFSQPPLRRLSCEPPPVPPKASARGPPPRPPSRQLVLSNPAFCQTSDDDGSGEDDRHDNYVKGENSSLQKKSNYLDLGKDYGEFNISFV